VVIVFIIVGILWMYVWLKEPLSAFIEGLKSKVSGINSTAKTRPTSSTLRQPSFEQELQEAELRLKYGIPQMVAPHHEARSGAATTGNAKT